MANEQDKKTEKKPASKETATAKSAKPQDKPASAKASAAKKTAAKAPAKKAAAKKPAAKAKASSKKSSGAKRPQKLVGTLFPTTQDVSSEWHLVDAEGKTLGRLSTEVARVLMGKHKPSFSRFNDTGDFIIVVNAEKVVLTGNKREDKRYHYHTGYAGGIKSFSPKDLFEKHPERVIERAVFGMLPKGHMGRRWYKKLKVYAGADHPHKAQNPKPLAV